MKITTILIFMIAIYEKQMVGSKYEDGRLERNRLKKQKENLNLEKQIMQKVRGKKQFQFELQKKNLMTYMTLNGYYKFFTKQYKENDSKNPGKVIKKIFEDNTSSKVEKQLLPKNDVTKYDVGQMKQPCIYKVQFDGEKLSIECNYDISFKSQKQLNSYLNEYRSNKSKLEKIIKKIKEKDAKGKDVEEESEKKETYKENMRSQNQQFEELNKVKNQAFKELYQQQGLCTKLDGCTCGDEKETKNSDKKCMVGQICEYDGCHNTLFNTVFFELEYCQLQNTVIQNSDLLQNNLNIDENSDLLQNKMKINENSIVCVNKMNKIFQDSLKNFIYNIYQESIDRRPDDIQSYFIALMQGFNPADKKLINFYFTKFKEELKEYGGKEKKTKDSQKNQNKKESENQKELEVYQKTGIVKKIWWGLDRDKYYPKIIQEHIKKSIFQYQEKHPQDYVIQTYKDLLNFNQYLINNKEINHCDQLVMEAMNYKFIEFEEFKINNIGHLQYIQTPGNYLFTKQLTPYLAKRKKFNALSKQDDIYYPLSPSITYAYQHPYQKKVILNTGLSKLKRFCTLSQLNYLEENSTDKEKNDFGIFLNKIFDLKLLLQLSKLIISIVNSESLEITELKNLITNKTFKITKFQQQTKKFCDEIFGIDYVLPVKVQKDNFFLTDVNFYQIYDYMFDDKVLVEILKEQNEHYQKRQFEMSKYKNRVNSDDDQLYITKLTLGLLIDSYLQKNPIVSIKEYQQKTNMQEIRDTLIKEFRDDRLFQIVREQERFLSLSEQKEISNEIVIQPSIFQSPFSKVDFDLQNEQIKKCIKDNERKFSLVSLGLDTGIITIQKEKEEQKQDKRTYLEMNKMERSQWKKKIRDQYNSTQFFLNYDPSQQFTTYLPRKDQDKEHKKNIKKEKKDKSKTRNKDLVVQEGEEIDDKALMEIEKKLQKEKLTQSYTHQGQEYLEDQKKTAQNLFGKLKKINKLLTSLNDKGKNQKKHNMEEEKSKLQNHDSIVLPNSQYSKKEQKVEKSKQFKEIEPQERKIIFENLLDDFIHTSDAQTFRQENLDKDSEETYTSTTQRLKNSTNLLSKAAYGLFNSFRKMKNWFKEKISGDDKQHLSDLEKQNVLFGKILKLI